MAKNCEWMHADAATGLLGINAFARYNPLRWSGAISFDECIKQLEATPNAKVTVKIPAGISSKEHTFCFVASAIAFVEDNDPLRRRKKLEAAQKAEDEADQANRAAEEAARIEAEHAERLRQALKEERINLAKENIAYYDATLTETAKHIEALNAQKAGTTAATAAATAPNCEWMFGDVTTGWVAKWNPLRWSGAQSFEVAVEKLEVEKAKCRPIVVRVPASVLSYEHRFPDCQGAIDFIKSQDPKQLELKTEEVEAALQNAMKTMDDAKEKLQEYKDELEDAEGPIKNTEGYA